MKVHLSAVLGAVAVIVLGAALFFATRRQRGELRPVVAILPRADGVREGAIVTYLGVEIGYVDRLRIHNGRVVAEIRIHRADADLRQSDTLHLRINGIFGDRILDVAPGSRSAPPLGPTDTLIGVAARGALHNPIGDSLRQAMLRDSQPVDRPCIASYLGLPCR
jgi:ABC-type transporter Mla subunit MlaD